METPHTHGGIPCPWCGSFSQPGATCEFCGSPMQAASPVSATAQAVTVMLDQPSPVLASDPSPVLASEPAQVLPFRTKPVPLGVSDQPPLVPSIHDGGDERGVGFAAAVQPGRRQRYRRSLIVRWLIEAVNS
jgi:hypothetical protein